MEYAGCMTTLRIVKTTFVNQYTRIGIRRMYDDIAYSKDDIRKRSIHILEYAVCMTTLRIGKTTRRHVVSMFKNTLYI